MVGPLARGRKDEHYLRRWGSEREIRQVRGVCQTVTHSEEADVTNSA